MMTQSRLATFRSRTAPGFFVLAMTLVGCDQQDPVAAGPADPDLALATARAPAARAFEVKSTFVARLSGMSAGTDSNGAGEAVFRFADAGATVHFRLNVANIRDVTMAHIHVAAEAGGNGPPAVWLYPEGPPPALIPGRSQGSLGVGEISASDLVGPLAGMPLEALRAAFVEGRAYVNVHTTQHPGGEIRGTIG